MTLAQFKVKDQSSFFGFLWSFLNPLIVLSLLYVMFNSQLGNGIEHYSIYLLIGIIHYTHFSNATTAAMQILLARAGLTRDTVFPKDVLVISTVITNTIDFSVSLIICVAMALLSGIHATRALLALPLVFAFQILVVLWVSFLTSGLYVYIRDLAHVYQVLLRLLFFVTPIFYSLSLVGKGAAKYIVMANPLTHAIVFSRGLIIDGTLFDVNVFVLLLTINAFLVLATYKVFKRLEPSFSENV